VRAPGALTAVPLAAALLALLAGPGRAGDTSAGEQAFADVARVLLSPRCRNCHPAGDAPLQGDEHPAAHAMNVSRKSVAAGLPCHTCHRDTNHPERGGPPGARGWALPPAAVPMVFEGRTPRQLCLQLLDPTQTRGRDLAALREHLASDPLVLWGWSPGPGRAPPPLGHAQVVKSFQAWIDAGTPCPR
jgi:hypothetical protein